MIPAIDVVKGNFMSVRCSCEQAEEENEARRKENRRVFNYGQTILLRKEGSPLHILPGPRVERKRKVEKERI